MLVWTNIYIMLVWIPNKKYNSNIKLNIYTIIVTPKTIFYNYLNLNYTIAYTLYIMYDMMLKSIIIFIDLNSVSSQYFV